MYKLTKDERAFLEKVQVISGYDFSTLRNIMIAMNIVIALEMYAGESEIPIPFLCKLKIRVANQGKRIKETYEVESTNHFKEILSKITKDKPEMIEKYLQQEIRQELKKRMFPKQALISL
jgi:hypothetical protein